MKQEDGRCVFSEDGRRRFSSCGVKANGYYVRYSPFDGDRIERFKNNTYDGFYIVLRPDPAPCKGVLMCDSCAKSWKGLQKEHEMMECKKDGALL